MRESEINAIFISLLSSQFDAEGITGVEILPMGQVVKVGPPSGKAIVFQRLTNTPRGSPGRFNTLDAGGAEFTHTEAQAVETAYQFTALCPIDTTEDFPLTASDLADLSRAFLLSDIGIDAFFAKRIQVQSATLVRDTFHRDESGRFEAQPNFDLVLTRSQDVVRKVAIADPINGHFYRAQRG